MRSYNTAIIQGFPEYKGRPPNKPLKRDVPRQTLLEVSGVMPHARGSSRAGSPQKAHARVPRIKSRIMYILLATIKTTIVIIIRCACRVKMSYLTHAHEEVNSRTSVSAAKTLSHATATSNTPVCVRFPEMLSHAISRRRSVEKAYFPHET